MQTRAKQVAEVAKLAWAAGFIDGEGYVGIVRQVDKHKIYSQWYRPTIDVGQSHLEPIRLLQNMFGVGIIRKIASSNGNPFWHWTVTGPIQIHDVLTQMLPYFVVKRRQAELLLQFRSTVVPRGSNGRMQHLPNSIMTEREALWAAVKALNTVTGQADRLSEKAPHVEGDAIVGTASNKEDAEAAEMTARLRLA